MRGGKRPGAGRKPGTPNRASAERQAEIAASGLTPLDFMMAVLRDDGANFADRFEAAKAAAPYVHPRLAAVEMNAAVSMTHEQWLESLSDGGSETEAPPG